MSGPGPRQTEPTGRAGSPVLRRLGRLRARARAALLWESLWPRAWPALGVVGVFLVLALSGFFLLLSPLAHLILLAVLIAALVLALMRGARGFAVPGDEVADRRLERSSGLSHRPLSALLDRPAGGDAAAQALWRAHQAREAARIRALRVGLPRPGLAARDPRALRTGLAVALLAAVVMAGGEAPERLRRALWPEGPAAAPPLAAKLEAWVTPPAYTGAPPVFLDPAGGSVTVPAGSRLRAVLSGGPAIGTAPELLRDDRSLAAFQPLGPGSHSAEAVLDAGGRLVIRQGGGEVAGWTVAVQEDAAPRIAFAEPPAQAARGLATRIPWRAEDDWGVAAASAEIRLAARPEAPPLSIDLPLPAGQPKTPRGVAQPDLSAHPWAGLAVRMRLVARDGAGQEGRSEEVALTLPERGFNHPVARGLVLLRKGLSLDPNARGRAMEGLDRLSEQPQAFENDTATALALRSARGRLEDQRPEAVGEAQQTMWDTALALEEGRADRTARALAETRERLREALREREQQERERAEAQRQEQEARREAERQDEARQQAEANQRPESEQQNQQRPGENRDQASRQEQQQAQREAEAQRREAERDAKREETDRRIQELREAVRRHLDALAERLQRENGEENAPRPRARQQEQREAERRTDRMREQNREDRPEDAERELAELEKMLEELENGRMAENQREERRQRRERGQQQMGVIQDMVRRESRLLDGAHQRSESDAARREQARRPNYPWNRTPPPPEPPAAAPAPTADARTQRALRRALGELMQQQGDLTGDVPAPLGRADQAMRESAEALAGGGDPRPHQERAIRELSEGGRQMAQRMQRQFGRPDQGEQGEEGEGEGQGDAMAEGGEQGGEGQDQLAQNGEGRDPLGRRLREGTGTAEEGGDTRVPDEAEILRTRRLQEELRRRLAERERPTTELDYIDRLLRLF
ncbi:DUF4175 domain-containing protein [Roseomonas populi]|uniref:DUF4175 domain-containing protein n=1 Tax=Roseomonas populi TaxID=3121582 RepID=A0ABT1X9W8_9PROT|nr:DUF4175 domain-containing protein [Roseomonas pecuniae]MCR0984489.1 DUF4175 domain-containing protein [Roseomonas pecuniae]